MKSDLFGTIILAGRTTNRDNRGQTTVSNMFAIDTSNGLFYEGQSHRGHGVWPAPFVSAASIIESDDDLAHLFDGSYIAAAKLLFREDFFDPVTRIRRGRLYSQPTASPQEWYVQQHPAYPNETGHRGGDGAYYKSLHGFNEWQEPQRIKVGATKIALGSKQFFSLWRAVGLEKLITGEYLLTLQSRSTMGTLTELNEDKLPATGKIQILDAVNKVVESANRAGPESVIDRCRDAAQVIVGRWCAELTSDQSWITTELGKLLSRIDGSEQLRKHKLICYSAGAIARLHARKPNEQEARQLPPLHEEDALLALQCLSAIIREVGYSAV